MKKGYGGQSQRQPPKKSRRSPQEKNRLRRLFRHLRQPAKPPRLFVSCPLRRDFYLMGYFFEKGLSENSQNNYIPILEDINDSRLIEDKCFLTSKMM
ncbi:hypothetical protein [Neisseria chenwenguii]|uniref:hypothetical protein n=1 Tax=Neisseria chenwenguii TaxID=1853278 RepID=UPI000F51761B|nr:hypothetical protein [Neisseria chenwenguii]